MNEPELRFKDDDGSEFPEWGQKKLSDIAKYSKDKISVANISAEDYVSTDSMLQDYAGIVSSETVPNTGTLCSFKNGDILMSNIRPYLKKIWLANKNGGCNSDVLVIRPNSSQNPQFVFELLARDDFISYVMTGAKGSKMPRGDKTFIMNYAIPYVCIEEQQKIADLFSTLDNVIDSVQKEVDSWEQMKRGVMQKLFSQEVRFKADDGSEFPEWEEVTINTCCNFYNGDRGKNYPSSNDMVEDGIAFINAGDLVDGKINLNNAKKITREKYNTLGGAKIKMHDILYCLRGSLGKNALVNSIQEGTVASSLVVIRPQSIDYKFLFYILNSDIEYRQRVLHDEGCAQPNLSAKSVGEFMIPYPCLEEQQKIADCLSELDSVIEKTKQKLEAYKQLKKGLMQRMFV